MRQVRGNTGTNGWRVFRGCITAAALAVALTACGGDGSSARVDGEDSGGASSVDSSAAKDFTLVSLEGSEFQLSRSDAKVHLIDFWATWCAPCREEVPMLNELHETYGDQGLRIVAISDETEGEVREFAADFDVRYEMLLDDQDLAQSYRVFGLPTAFLVNADGEIVDTMMGAKPPGVLEDKIRDMLGLGPKA